MTATWLRIVLVADVLLVAGLVVGFAVIAPLALLTVAPCSAVILYVLADIWKGAR